MNIPKKPILLTVLAVILAGAAPAATLKYVGSGTPDCGNALSAQALFQFDSLNTLTITLTNIASVNTSKYVNSDILFGMFFGSTNLGLTPLSAVAPKMINGPGAVSCSSNCDQGRYWQYKSFSPANSNHHTANGIATAGYGIFGGSGGYFGSSGSLAKHGIVPATFPGNLGESVNDNNFGPFADNSLTFTLRTPAGFTLTPDRIGPVYFQYGTATSDSCLRGTLVTGVQTPEPLSTILIGAGLVAIAVVQRRRNAA